MLKRKKAKNRFLVEIICNDVSIFAGDLMDVKLKEDIILKKSIEFFNDSEPCCIHRGAVMVRLLDEIKEKLAENAVGVFSDYIDYPEGSLIQSLNE